MFGPARRLRRRDDLTSLIQFDELNRTVRTFGINPYDAVRRALVRPGYGWRRTVCVVQVADLLAAAGNGNAVVEA
jgi:hypothetical protein